MLDVIVLFYISLPIWPDINALCTEVNYEGFSVTGTQSPQVLTPMI
jgi:hypothetical protein